MKEFTYNGKAARLSRVMAEFYPLLSYNQILRLIKDKEIRVNGEKISSDVTIENGSIIRSYAKDAALKTVYEDENIVVVYKPKGLASEGDASAESVMADSRRGGLFLCHRLDTNTDGLLMFAKSEAALNETAKGFKEGKVEKVYAARVYGRISGDVVYTDYLLKNAKEGKVKVFSERKQGASEIVTAVRVLGYDGGTTLIEASIHSGKTHQIRAQLAAHGHFILGDGKYGRDDINRKFNFKKQQLSAKKLIFRFEKDSFLYYLNGKNIQID